jgi:hypothetical protein
MPSDQEQLQRWRAQLIRLTAFAPLGATFSGEVDKWWQVVAGEPPESKNEKPRESVVTLEGGIGPGRLSLACTLNRVDWVLAAEISLQTGKEPPALGLYPEIEQFFSAKLAEWWKVCPPLVRLAWGAVVIQPVDSKATGYRTLQGYLRDVRLDEKSSSEFLYQINRPRKSSVVNGLVINRLQKWSVGLIQLFNLQVGGASHIQSSFEPGFSMCRLELDINSAYERTEPISSGQIPPLYAELVSTGKEIAIKGDIP